MRPADQRSDEEEVSLRAVATGGLRHEVADILREAIWGGVLKPGQRLNEQRLSREIGVSRPPLREAIRVLEQEGLVTSTPRRGTFVRTFTGQDIFDIYAVRCGLEGMAAELLMDHVTPETLRDLEGMIDRAESSRVAGLGGRIDQDLEFHRRLVRLSGSGLLASMWEQLAGRLRLALTLVDPAFFEPEYFELTHRLLIQAMRNRDVEETWRRTRSLLDVGRSLRDRWHGQFGTRELGGERGGGATTRAL